MADDLSWADAYPGHERVLDEIFCLTFIKGVDGTDALRRMGGLADTVATRVLPDVGKLHNFDDGYPMVASVLPLGEWTVVFEPSGFEGVHMITALSRGTEAVSVLRHDYASNTFGYAVDGELITGFDPSSPARRYGTEPDRLLSRMVDVGFATSDVDHRDDHPDDHRDDDGDISRSLRVIEGLTGVLPTFEALTGPLVSAHIEPWFSAADKPPATRPGTDGPVDAVAETRRLAGLHGLADTPGLADALAAAERGESVAVTPESPLGQHVRAWLTESRRASWSLNDHGGRHRMTEEERRAAFGLGWLTGALGAALAR